MMRVLQFTNEATEGQYLVFVDDTDANAPSDYARPGFTLYREDECDLGRVIPGEGDVYMLSR